MKRISVHQGEQVVLDDGTFGEVLSYCNSQVWENDALRDTVLFEVKTICGIETISNEQIMELV